MPARDEQRLLPDLLRACAALDRTDEAVTLCLFLDGCTDASEAVVRASIPAMPFPVLVASGPRHADANAGRARGAAMALGLRALGGAVDGLLLATDADSAPDPRWVQAARHALAVADVAAGRVVRQGGASDLNQCRLESYYDRLHRHRRALDPVPWDSVEGCHYGGGANFGVRADCYVALGGFQPVHSGEDALFLDDAARAGWRVRRDPAMLVTTSSRRIGRAPHGLAAALEAMDSHGLPLVPHPGAADWQYRAHRLARQTFARIDHAESRAALGRAIALDGDHVLGVARDCPNAEAFCVRIVPAGPGYDLLVPLAVAEQLLEQMESASCEQAA